MMAEPKRKSRSEVPVWLLEIGEYSVKEAAQLLGIPVPALRWVEDPEGNRLAWVDADDLTAINLNIPKMDSAYTARAMVFHECRHIWQELNSRFLDRQAGERDAIEWSYQHTGHLVKHLAEEWEI